MMMEKAHAVGLVKDVMAQHGVSGDAIEDALHRALARAGLWQYSRFDEEQLNLLLEELAAEGGRVQEVAETIAAWRNERSDELVDDAA